MEVVKTKSDEIGIIVGRFQVPELHDGHIELIDNVISKHKQVCLFLGVPRTRATPNNPLDYASRVTMFQEKYPDLIYQYIVDIGKGDEADRAWSNNLDSAIQNIFPGRKAKLYGSRDSFIKHYYGKFPTEEMENSYIISGTQIRNDVINNIHNSFAWRAGNIHAVNNSFFNPIPTVDVALIDGEYIWLGRKQYESKWRLFGGFVDSSDQSFEEAAARELREEAGISEQMSEFKYVMSCKIDDARYENEPMKIITSLYTVELKWGAPKPGDDILEIKKFKMSELKKSDVVSGHHILIGKSLSRYSVKFDGNNYDI